METIIRIREAVSADLALRRKADNFFDAIEKVPSTTVVIDFSGVKSISRSFAHQYQIRKRSSKKKVSETSLPPFVTKMFDVVIAAKKPSRIDSDSIPLMTI
jgi:hypothetical protein